MRGWPRGIRDGREKGLSPGEASNSPFEEFVEMITATQGSSVGVSDDGLVVGGPDGPDGHERRAACWQSTARTAIRRCLPNWSRATSASCITTCDASWATPTLAEDVFQATFLQVHVKRDVFESGPQVSAVALHDRDQPGDRRPAAQPPASPPELEPAACRRQRITWER